MWFPAVLPEVIAAVHSNCGQGHLVHRLLGGRPEVVQRVLLQGVRVLHLSVTVSGVGGVEASCLLVGVHRQEGEDV